MVAHPPIVGDRLRPMTTEAEAEATQTLHGGRMVARRLKAYGVTKLFTLTGGHLFSIYDGCRAEGIDLVDVRHESSAAFAAEGWAKVTREPGPMKHGTTVIAFVEDPTGYKIELIERA